MRTIASRALVCAGVGIAVLGAGQLAGSTVFKDTAAVKDGAALTTTPDRRSGDAAESGVTGKAAAPAATPFCGITWGSADKSGGTLRTPSLIRVASTQDACWDRVTFEFAGAVDGYQVGYAAEVPTEGQGLDLAPFTAGAEHLAVSLRAPATSLDATAGEHTGTALGDRTLRDVVFGGSFEGHTTFAVGVRARLPFRVSVLAGPGTHSRIAIDIAHQW